MKDGYYHKAGNKQIVLWVTLSYNFSRKLNIQSYGLPI